MIRRYVIQNIWWKLLSVLIAFLLWVAVAQEPELATSISVPILFRNLPDDMDISSELPETVHLEVRGPAPKLTAASLSRTAIVLDLSNVQPGERTFNIHDWSVRDLPTGVVFYRAVPSQVSVRFERLLSKSVPIEPLYAKTPPDGYVVTKYTFDPADVRLRGPENRVRNIDHVVTDPIDLSGVVSHASMRVHVKVGDPHVMLETNAEVRFTVELQKLASANGH